MLLSLLLQSLLAPANREDQCAAHLVDTLKHTLNAGPHLRDAKLTPRLTLRQGFVTLALWLDLVPIALGHAEPPTTIYGAVVLVGVGVTAGFGPNDERI